MVLSHDWPRPGTWKSIARYRAEIPRPPQSRSQDRWSGWTNHVPVQIITWFKDSRLRCKPLRSSLKTPEELTSRPTRRSCRIHRFVKQCALSFPSSFFFAYFICCYHLLFSFSNRPVLSRLAARSSSLQRPVTRLAPDAGFDRSTIVSFILPPFHIKPGYLSDYTLRTAQDCLGFSSLFLVCRCRPVILDTQ